MDEQGRGIALPAGNSSLLVPSMPDKRPGNFNDAQRGTYGAYKYDHGYLMPDGYGYIAGYISGTEYIPSPGFINRYEVAGTPSVLYYAMYPAGSNDAYLSTASQFYPYHPINELPDFSEHIVMVTNPIITVKDEFNYSVTTGLSNPTLATQLSNMPEGTAAKILMDAQGYYYRGEYYGVENILKKAHLDSIAGSDKTIVAYKDGLQWVINGKDIINGTKDIYLDVSYGMVWKGIYNIDPFVAGAYSEIVGGNGQYVGGSTLAKGNPNGDPIYTVNEDFVKIEFYPNGVLPGKAQVRFKADILYDKGLSGSVPHLYYYDGTKLIPEDTDFDLNFDGADKWCYMLLSHNSAFAVAPSSKLSSVRTDAPIKDPDDPITDPTINTDPTVNTDPAANTELSQVTGIRSAYTTYNVVKGKTLTIKYDYDLVAGSTIQPKFSWSSSNPKVVSVDPNTGKVKGLAAGKSAKITVTADNGLEKTFTVKVVNKAEKVTNVSVKSAPKTMKVGQTKVLKLKVTPSKATGAVPSFSVDNKGKKVVTVDKAGKVTTIEKGTAKITVKVGGKKTVITIKVK